MSISPVSSTPAPIIPATPAPKPAAAAPVANNIGPAVQVSLSNVASGDTDHDGDSK